MKVPLLPPVDGQDAIIEVHTPPECDQAHAHVRDEFVIHRGTITINDVGHVTVANWHCEMPT